MPCSLEKINLMPEKYFSKERFINLPESSFKEVYRNEQLELPVDPKDLVMFLQKGEPLPGGVHLRTLPFHHRSADLDITTAVKEKITTAGKSVEHVYNQIDIKGGGFVYPETHVSKKDNISLGSMRNSPEAVFLADSEETPWRYNVLGLVDERMAVQAAERANQLAAAGMRTEAVAGVYRLKEFHLNGKLTTVEDFKKQAALELKSAAVALKKAGNTDDYEVCVEKIADLKKQFDPVIVVRLMRSVLRWRDLRDAENSTERQAMLAEACNSLNIEAEALGKQDHYEFNTREGKETWLKTMGYETGKGIGIMQANGFVHEFLHLGNMTLAGEIVDLDSVQPMIIYKKGRGVKSQHEPFFSVTDTGYAYINPEIGEHRQPDPQFGLPKCLLKDFRDACFSFRLLINDLTVSEALRFDRANLCQQFIDGYVAGLGQTEPFQKIGLTNQQLIGSLEKLAHDMIENNKHYDPIPEDKQTV